MISEKDIADFKAIDCTKARAALKGLSYFTHEEQYYKDSKQFLEEFMQQIELLQNKGIKQLPALFKAKPFDLNSVIGNPIDEKYE